MKAPIFRAAPRSGLVANQGTRAFYYSEKPATGTGSGYGDVDAALSEIKALQAAFGPAIGASITTALESIND